MDQVEGLLQWTAVASYLAAAESNIAWVETATAACACMCTHAAYVAQSAVREDAYNLIKQLINPPTGSVSFGPTEANRQSNHTVNTQTNLKSLLCSHQSINVCS